MREKFNRPSYRQEIIKLVGGNNKAKYDPNYFKKTKEE